MSTFFFDSSALVKRYVEETGSAWVKGCFTESLSDSVFIAEVTLVEIAAAVARRIRGNDPPGLLWNELYSLMIRDSQGYDIVPLDRAAVEQAMLIAFRHGLRAYDAVQLWSAISARQRVQARGLQPLTFVSSDKDLLEAAATAEYQFQIVDPNTL